MGFSYVYGPATDKEQAIVLIRAAAEGGVTRDELVETITHHACYAGWPSAVTVVGGAREVSGQKST